MNQEYKIKILVMAVIALALLNITTIITVFLKKQGQKEAVTGKMIDQPEVDYKGHFFTFYLQLDSLQIEQFKIVNEEYLKHKRSYSKEIGQLTVALANHINSAGGRIGEIPYYTSIINNHKQLKYENYKYYYNVRSICNESQKALLDSFFSSILCIGNSICSLLEYDKNGKPVAVANWSPITSIIAGPGTTNDNQSANNSGANDNQSANNTGTTNTGTSPNQ
ncbi:MAG: hypothetical protein EOM16_10110 [Bacteroidia bacterium]|nr:hypothetical protein [Bacteroidia bacterium]